MFLTRNEYDRGVNTFSPEGRLFQVEYALEAIKMGTTAIGIQSEEGVVLVVEKRITSPLLEASSVEKLYQIDDHVGCAVSGLTPDARTMIEHARVEAQAHRFAYNEPMRIESISQSICDLALQFGEGAKGQKAAMSRPFGVALLVAGYDDLGASLYYADPSGTFVKWKAKAIGAGSEGAQDELQSEYTSSITLVQAENLGMRILGKIMEEKITDENIQVACVDKNGYRVYSADQVKEILNRQ